MAATSIGKNHATLEAAFTAYPARARGNAATELIVNAELFFCRPEE
jgi:hypothetical protein